MIRTSEPAFEKGYLVKVHERTHDGNFVMLSDRDGAAKLYRFFTESEYLELKQEKKLNGAALAANSGNQAGSR